MTKHSVRDGKALAASIRAGRDHVTHGSLWGKARSAYPYFHEGILPRKFHQALHPSNYVIGSYGTPIAWRAPLAALDALSAAGVYRVKSSRATTQECLRGGHYAALRVPGEDRVWIVPTVNYSPSTGRHQTTALDAILRLGADIVRYL